MRERIYSRKFVERNKKTLQVSRIISTAIESIKELDFERFRNISSQLNKEKNNHSVKQCFHYEESKCSGNIIKAHSIQRNGRLSLLEGDVKGNKVVYHLGGCKLNDLNSSLNRVVVGKASASTFSGFCSYHDKLLFAPIEDYDFNENDTKQLFLYSYRTFAFNYHHIYEEFMMYDKHRLIQMSKINSNITDLQIEDYINTQMMVNLQVKRELYRMYCDNEFGLLNYFIYTITDKIPVACAGVIKPNRSYLGKEINTIASSGRESKTFTVDSFT